MELHRYSKSMELKGQSMEFHGITWNSVELHGIPWNSMKLHEYSTDTPWTLHGGSMEIHGIPWRYFTRVVSSKIRWKHFLGCPKYLMHSERCYKILYLFGHLRGSWVFSKLQELQYYFPENFRPNLTFYESENFSDSSVHHILNPKFQVSCFWYK